MAKTEIIGGYIEFMLSIEWPKWNLPSATLKLIFYRDYQDKINRQPYCHYANYRDGQNRINRRPYWIYCIYIDYQNEIRIILIIEMAKKELIGGHIEIMLIMEMAKIESTGGYIEFMLSIEWPKWNLPSATLKLCFL